MDKFQTNGTLETALKNMVNQGLIVPRTENNKYLVLSYKGAGTLITSKWNIKIYNTGSGVCTDAGVIKDFVGGRLRPPDPSLKLIQIDDAGIGSPIGSVMVGATDGERVVTDVLDMSYFKPGPFERKEYLTAYANQGWALIHKEFQADSKTHRIEICTGFININLLCLLREKGFDVRQAEIKGLLQDKLEDLFRDYIKEITGGEDLAYDPKELHASQISNYYYKALNFGKEKAPHLLKSGWKSIQESEQTDIFKYLDERTTNE